MIQARGTSSVFAAVGQARTIVATAYLLAQGRLRGALLQAARRGARVVVRVEGRPFADSSGWMRRVNEAAVRQLRAAGADARLVDNAGPANVMHMKAVVCDGVAYLDDRNFTSKGDEIVLRDDSQADVGAVVAAAYGKPHAALRSFSTTKEQAIRSERALLSSADRSHEVDVETESFSFDGAAYAELKKLAKEGVHCRLIVAKRELDAAGKHAVQILERAGVQVHAAAFNGKVAIVDGERAWVSSANSTSTHYDGNQTDWAVRTRSRPLVDTLQSQFDAHWRSSKPLTSS